jgi:alkylated DNA repair dioxygenase AlkB
MEIYTEKSYLTKKKIINLSLLEKCVKYIEDKLEERPKIIVYGKECRQNRDVGFFSDVVDGYKYSNSFMEAMKLDEFLKELLDLVNELTNNNFNGILINYYENGNNYIGAHSDNESELGNNGVVSVSYGSNRKFRIREKMTKKIVKDIELKNGDLVHMGGDFQREFTHEIPVQKKIKESRYSFTFRRHL